MTATTPGSRSKPDLEADDPNTPTVRITLDEANALADRGEFDHLAKQPTPHEGPELGDDFWQNAELVEPKAKVVVSVRVDPHVLEHFKAEGPGHLTRMASVLRAYVNAKEKQAS